MEEESRKAIFSEATEESKRIKREAVTLATAAVVRLGENSPVSLLVTDGFFFEAFCKHFLVRHPLVDSLTATSTPKEATAALKNIAHMTFDTEGLDTKLLLAGAADAVVSSMSKNAAFPDVQCAACLALGNCASNEANRRKILEAGAVEASLAAIRLHKNVSVSEMAFNLLRNMACESNLCKDEIAARGGLSAIIEVLRAHVGGDGKKGEEGKEGEGEEEEKYWGNMIEEAVAALANMSAVNVHNQQVIAQLGGIELVVAAMSKFPDVQQIAERGCAAISSIASNHQQNKRRAAEQGALWAIQNAVARFAADPKIATWSACAVWQILSTAEEFAKFMTPEILAAIQESGKRFPANVEVQQCIACLTRAEHPAAIRARTEHRCTLEVAAPCPTPCDASRGYYCSRCSIPQTIYRCLTCDEFSTRARRICETCFEVHHKGHSGLKSFRPGSCDQAKRF